MPSLCTCRHFASALKILFRLPNSSFTEWCPEVVHQSGLRARQLRSLRITIGPETYVSSKMLSCELQHCAIKSSGPKIFPNAYVTFPPGSLRTLTPDSKPAYRMMRN